MLKSLGGKVAHGRLRNWVSGSLLYRAGIGGVIPQLFAAGTISKKHDRLSNPKATKSDRHVPP
ncbi:MAG: hypothetical protein Aurels2KO_36490 [Aureliella sp.]